jgi:DNA-binding MarR family transcriptional regulator
MGATVDDQDLTDALVGLGTVLEGIKAAASRPLGLTPQQAHLLCVIETRERTHGELADLLQCDKTNITGLVSRLERRHLVGRQLDPEDRRVTRVALTTRGAALMSEFRDSVSKAVADPLKSWSAGRRSKLSELALSATDLLRTSQ